MRFIAITFFVFVLVLSSGSFKKSQSETLMQCMQKCIREAGKFTDANKTTCKTRCAVVTFKGQPTSIPDCMGEYKACRKQCGKEKTCLRKCKERQMACQ